MESTEYYHVRAEQERRAATQSADLSARKAHETMAVRYERLAAGERLTMGIVERN